MFEMGKTYKTRGGGEVKLVHDFEDGASHPLLWVLGRGDVGGSYRTTGEGRYWSDKDNEHPLDIALPETFVWMNVYDDEDGSLRMGGFVYGSPEAAKEGGTDDRVGCIKVKLEARFDD